MTIKIIQERLDSYHCETILDEQNAIKEITQEVALLALSRVGFFKIAEFHEGTALRILYNLPRFSEDLDFALITPDPAFDFTYYLDRLSSELSGFGYEVDVKDRSKSDNAFKMAFLKDDSIGKQLSLTFPNQRHNKAKLKIKLEVDTNPPLGATLETKYLDFPFPYSVFTKDLSSSFSGKLHALLCRPFIKGRDWYDFLWYTSKATQINYTLLENALIQAGPWSNQELKIDKQWLLHEMSLKINTIDWQQAKADVEKFIKPMEQKSLELWSVDLFQDRVDKMGLYLVREM